MKRCYRCNRIYSDDTLFFCLEDGSSLSPVSDNQRRIWVAGGGIVFGLFFIAVLTSAILYFAGAKRNIAKNDFDNNSNSSSQSEDPSDRLLKEAPEKNSDLAVNSPFANKTKVQASGCNPPASDRVKNPNINFYPGSAEMMLDSIEGLREISEELKQSNCFIEIAAHTDNTGNEKANIKLSQARADAVKTELSKLGCETGLAQGYGSKSPVADNSTKEGRAKNQRIEFKFWEK